MKINENTSVAMPVKNMIGIIIAISMGIFAYTEITARLTSLETSRELMNADLLKASEQTTVDKEQFLLLEDLYETIEKHQELLDKNIHNQVMLIHIEKQLDKALNDIEKLKDKRVASRGASKSIEYQCIKSMAETEIYMGEKSIKALILD